MNILDKIIFEKKQEVKALEKRLKGMNSDHVLQNTSSTRDFQRKLIQKRANGEVGDNLEIHAEQGIANRICDQDKFESPEAQAIQIPQHVFDALCGSRDDVSVEETRSPTTGFFRSSFIRVYYFKFV